MARYNVGDRVTIRSEAYLSANAVYGYDSRMGNYAGMTATITSIPYGSEYRIDLDDGVFIWGPSDFCEGESERRNEKMVTKETLKESWGEYCDTDKLVDDMKALLTKYHHRNTEYGVCKVLDEYFKNKKELIDLFKTSSNYMGDMRIMLDVELERENARNEVWNFCENFSDKIKAKKTILKYTDENGKKLADYLKCGIKSLKAADLLDESIKPKLIAETEGKNNFYEDGSTRTSNAALSEFNDQMCRFRYIYQSTISDEVAASLTKEGAYKIAPNMKTARAFNRVCSYYGIDKAHPKKETVTHGGVTTTRTVYPYDKLFAQYSDMVSGTKRKLKFFISLNPIDYLTMSFGVSWASCHTIDKTNIRRMPNNYSGMYCGGTMSYMLDSTSIITFVHDHVPTDWEDGKIYRTMFHFKDSLLIQGRVYPQGNDGNTDLYKVFRGYMQDELTRLLGLEKTTWIKRSESCYRSVESTGHHYRDYENFGDCNASYPKERPEAQNVMVQVGHEPMCPYCGEISYNINNDCISHYSCDAYNPETGEFIG